jgi:histidyl-tRNA synthetase
MHLDAAKFDALSKQSAAVVNDAIAARERGEAAAAQPSDGVQSQLLRLVEELHCLGVLRWCEFDSSIVRGLAYYTGTVFEIHEATGSERAIAGGGRYDKLVELFGGPPTPACGFAMGDVVLSLVLKDKGLLKPPEDYLPRPDAFVIAASDESASRLAGLVSSLRRSGFHVRHSYKTTRNVGKLLGEASKARSLCAIILGDKLGPDLVDVKDLQSGTQGDPVSIEKLPEVLHELQSKYCEQ